MTDQEFDYFPAHRLTPQHRRPIRREKLEDYFGSIRVLAGFDRPTAESILHSGDPIVREAWIFTAFRPYRRLR